MGFGSRRVADNADVDIATELHAFGCLLVNTRHKLEKESLFDVFVSVDHGGDGVDETGVNAVTVDHGSEVFDFCRVHGCEDARLSLLDGLLDFGGLVLSEGVDNLSCRAGRGLTSSRCIRYDHAAEESKAVRKITNAQCFQTSDTIATSIISSSTPIITNRHRFVTRHAQLTDIRNNDELSSEDALLTGLSSVNNLTAQDYVHSPGHAACGDLRAVLLNAALLPIHEGTSTDVQLPCEAVLTGLVGTLCRFGVAVCLLNILDDRPAGFANEGCQVKLWSNFGCSCDGTGHGEKLADIVRAQGANAAHQREVVEGQCEDLVGLLIRSTRQYFWIRLRCGTGLARRRGAHLARACRLAMLAEIFGLVLGDGIVEGANNVGIDSVVM